MVPVVRYFITLYSRCMCAYNMRRFSIYLIFTFLHFHRIDIIAFCVYLYQSRLAGKYNRINIFYYNTEFIFSFARQHIEICIYTYMGKSDIAKREE